MLLFSWVYTYRVSEKALAQKLFRINVSEEGLNIEEHIFIFSRLLRYFLFRRKSKKNLS